MTTRLRSLISGFVILLTGCGIPQSTEPKSAIESTAPQQALERWSPIDDARKLGQPIEHRLGALPLEGEVAQAPWVGSYWPTYLDSINYRWAGPRSESPARKYGRAFGVANVEDKVSRYHGIDSVRGSSCSNYGSCGTGYMCGHRAGREQGSCLPLWWGMCHGWAAAATLHAEPRHPVVYNGVEFGVSDIKALLTLSYSTSSTKQIGGRCERDKSAIPKDRSTRPTDPVCRDTNPGTYHLMLTNYVGLQRQSFIEDRSIDRDVWNQPIRRYRVLKMHEISQHKANRVLGVRAGGYAYNPAASRFAYVQTEVGYVREATAESDGYLGDSIEKYTFQDVYEYVLELDAAGNVVGGEWAGTSKLKHPDFLWVCLGPNSSKVAGGAIGFDNVLKLLQMSY
ncbi:MAG: hypothetical protein EOO40_02030 [Deltaproteobacteria bacterium]|nr:MAG: hypothetical protein EOO40_02030 [Deltaproteobacteria bacterium]